MSQVGLLSLLLLLACACTLVQCQSVAVPSYIYPGNNDWALITAAPGKVSFALINPLNGPGFYINNDYLVQTQRTRAAGIPVYGYVHSTYGSSSLDVIQKNISTYYSWYPIDGIFVDEAAVDCSYVSLYQSIYNYVKARGGTVIINPGYMTNECYMSTADIVLIAENKWDLYMAPYVPPSWIYRYAANRFWHVVWGVPQSEVWSVINTANSRNAGYVFVTDAAGDNPYNKLPSYWSTLIYKQMYTIGTSLDGGVFASVWVPSIDDCDRQCKKTIGCTGWTYDVCNGGTCWLTTAGGSVAPKTCRAAVRLIASTTLPASPVTPTYSTAATLIGRYSFGPYGSPVPDGFQLDSGYTYGAKADGNSYGWNAPNTNSIARRSPRSPNSAYDSFIQMQVNGWWYHWEIAVPAGFYSVHVVAGDPDWPACQEIAIEGQHLVSGCPNAASPFVEYTGVVSVTDGRLSITNVQGAWSDNKLCFVEIWVASGTVLSTTISAGSVKRQQQEEETASPTPASSESLSPVASTTPPPSATEEFERRFIDALCAVSHQPRERFRVLRVTPKSDPNSYTVDYIVLDADLIPDPNVTTLSTAVATLILSSKPTSWTKTGLTFLNAHVVSEHGAVPKKYNKAESITMYVMVGVASIALITLGVLIAAFFYIRHRRSTAIDATLVPTTSTVSAQPSSLQRHPSEMQLLGSSPAGSQNSVASNESENKAKVASPPSTANV